jgi:serine/threonine protein kinase
VLHRDLKPGNVLLGEFGETLVIDWGMAKVLGKAGANSSGAETGLVPLLPATDARATVCKQNRVLVHEIQGQWLTTGDPLNFLKATVYYALKHPEIGKAFAEFLRTLS